MHWAIYLVHIFVSSFTSQAVNHKILSKKYELNFLAAGMNIDSQQI